MFLDCYYTQQCQHRDYKHSYAFTCITSGILYAHTCACALCALCALKWGARVNGKCLEVT